MDLDQVKQCFEWIDGRYYLPSHLAKELIKEVEQYKKALKEIKYYSYKNDYYTGWSYDIAEKALEEKK